MNIYKLLSCLELQNDLLVHDNVRLIITDNLPPEDHGSCCLLLIWNLFPPQQDSHCVLIHLFQKSSPQLVIYFVPQTNYSVG